MLTNIRIAAATLSDRDEIYRLRHAVYASELAQHAENADGRLSDVLDPFNEYLVAKAGDDIAGFISVTPPTHGGGYSADKYFSRDTFPFPLDDALYEVRLLTVPSGRRGQSLAALLMYAALRFVVERGGTRIVALGRRELRAFYQKVGLEALGPTVQAGAVTYELMSATTARLQAKTADYAPLLRRWENVDWNLPFPFAPSEPCFHGGAFFEAIGDTFDALHRSREVVNADVLDAWFPPCPGALDALHAYLPWLARMSPPLDGAGLLRTIAAVRGVPSKSLALGAGSSSLIYLAFREWLGPDARVLVCDPTYGEYAHVLQHVVGCRVDRFALRREDDFRLDLDALADRLRQTRYDLAVLVNPNNPTGQMIPRRFLEPLLASAPPRTRFWIDEAYIDYASGDRAESLETFAAQSANVVVCKSLSKAYALSGLRAAYLCGPSALIAGVKKITPPWAVSLPAQVAAVAALRDPAYYAQRYRETATLRTALATALKQAIPPIDILEGVTNSLLCHLPPSGPDAAAVCAHVRDAGAVFLRDASRTSEVLSPHALRVAVKDEDGNRRIVDALSRAVGGLGA